jgi:hypothetical protein
LNFLRWLLAIVVMVRAVDCVAAGGKSPKTVAPAPKSATAPLPSFDLVTQQVKKILALDSEYQEGDLLTSSKVEKILSKLEQIHWKVADARDIVKLVLSDGDWLAVRLSGGEGKQFMRQVAAIPAGYDRIDRLRGLPDGQRLVSDLIQGPDGFTMIEYMTKTQGGQNLGDYLSEDEGGADFNKRTGRIYTEQELLKRLKTSYEAEAARRKGIEPPPPPKSSKSTAKKPTAKSSSKTKRPKRTAPAEQPAEDPPFIPDPPADGPPAG